MFELTVMEDIEVCYKNTSTGENVNLFWDEVPSSSLDEEDDLPWYVYICEGDPLVVRKTVNDFQCQRYDEIL